ncbi:MAG: phosphoribosylaminoimidazolesuccinocarboxamide synthase [Deltaproteobacteria bacterium]|jgi:phosphoribosylaminoimidazole-succinocarboxamide synthase|nr:phosphoribosylaminoimidazolesuccinocarboxamide synthase [Deltaproteobacteria bacterium]
MSDDALYEGKAKKIYATDDPDIVLVWFKDDATAFNGGKKGVIDSKGVLNNAISSLFFQLLEKEGIRTHFVREEGERTMLVRRVSVIPLEVVVRNIVAGSLSKRLGIPEGRELESPIVEFYYKDDSLGDPLVNEYHIAILKAATPEELVFLAKEALKVNQALLAYLAKQGIRLVDFKLEFGRAKDGAILLADEISPDTCRFWDSKTNEKLDKDRFRRDLGGVGEAYQEIHRRLKGS